MDSPSRSTRMDEERQPDPRIYGFGVIQAEEFHKWEPRVQAALKKYMSQLFNCHDHHADPQALQVRVDTLPANQMRFLDTMIHETASLIANKDPRLLTLEPQYDLPTYMASLTEEKNQLILGFIRDYPIYRQQSEARKRFEQFCSKFGIPVPQLPQQLGLIPVPQRPDVIPAPEQAHPEGAPRDRKFLHATKLA